MARTASSLAVLATPVTVAPSAVASCTANEPTPPDAPITSTRWPGSTRPTVVRAWSAVMPEIAETAACSKLTFSGLCASFDSLAEAYSAKVPLPMPNTSSPTAKRVTSAPTSTTRPATSMPSTGCFGRVSP